MYYFWIALLYAVPTHFFGFRFIHKGTLFSPRRYLRSQKQGGQNSRLDCLCLVLLIILHTLQNDVSDKTKLDNKHLESLGLWASDCQDLLVQTYQDTRLQCVSHTSALFHTFTSPWTFDSHASDLLFCLSFFFCFWTFKSKINCSNNMNIASINPEFVFCD